METELVTTENAQRLAKSFEPSLQEITDWGVQLRAMQPGPLRHGLAVERARDIRKYLDLVDSSELRENATRAHQVHDYMMKILKPLRLPACDRAAQSRGRTFAHNRQDRRGRRQSRRPGRTDHGERRPKRRQTRGREQSRGLGAQAR